MRQTRLTKVAGPNGLLGKRLSEANPFFEEVAGLNGLLGKRLSEANPFL